MECNGSLVWVGPNDHVELDETEDSQVVLSINGEATSYAVRHGIYQAAANAETSAGSSSQGCENANHGNSKKRKASEANLDNLTLN